MFDAALVVEQVQTNYAEHYAGFVANQLESCSACAPEVKLQLPEDSPLYGKLYALDFVDSGQPIEIWPDKMLEFASVNEKYGDLDLTLQGMRWDAVTLTMAGGNDVHKALQPWFAYWFDKEDARYSEDNLVGNVIHSVLLEKDVLSVDFGSASPEAFWQLIDTLEADGVTEVTVTYELQE